MRIDRSSPVTVEAMATLIRHHIVQNRFDILDDDSVIIDAAGLELTLSEALANLNPVNAQCSAGSEELLRSMPGEIELAGIVHDAADGGTSEEYCSWTMANRAAEALVKRLATVQRGIAKPSAGRETPSDKPGLLDTNPELFDILNHALGTMHYHRLMSALNSNGYQIVRDAVVAALGEPCGLANLRAIVADQPFQNSALSVFEISLILDNRGGFMPDEAVAWFRGARGTFGSGGVAQPSLGGEVDAADLVSEAWEAKAEAHKLAKLLKEGVECEYDDSLVTIFISDESNPSVGLDGGLRLSLSCNYEVIPVSLVRDIKRAMGDNWERCVDLWRQTYEASSISSTEDK